MSLQKEVEENRLKADEQMRHVGQLSEEVEINNIQERASQQAIDD